MFALAGFGYHFPVMVYVYQRTEEELNEILYQQSSAVTAALTLDTATPKSYSSDIKGLGGNMGTARGGVGAGSMPPSSYSAQLDDNAKFDKENTHMGNVNVS